MPHQSVAHHSYQTLEFIDLSRTYTHTNMCCWKTIL